MPTTTPRCAVLLLVGVVLLGVVELAPTASATVAFRDDGTGITCSITGSVSFNPPLTHGATGTSAVMFHDRLSACTGAVTQFGRTITRGTERNVVAEVITTDCLALAGATPVAVPAFVMRTRYLPRGRSPVPGSTTTWAAGTFHAMINGPMVISYTHASSVAGSFSTGTGPPPSLTEVIDQTANMLLAECGSDTGVKTLTFNGVNGASSVTLG